MNPDQWIIVFGSGVTFEVSGGCVALNFTFGLVDITFCLVDFILWGFTSGLWVRILLIFFWRSFTSGLVGFTSDLVGFTSDLWVRVLGCFELMESIVIALVVAPLARGQCSTYFLEGAPCTNGADDECCNLLREATDFWNPHVESIWCVCQGLQSSDIPVTRLNECDVVSGTDPYC
ncbi:hypothetical protein OSB04_019164 [Centaurea solstitialis]|uniref:Uncharacterized protein n=1 Tax=Centaurea solstitialis TaxID=347529 RepID=A0AA38WFL8_9ASTR|nr:hypothetical protein OSB04_019164 [Centaurea solstitialis]